MTENEQCQREFVSIANSGIRGSFAIAHHMRSRVPRANGIECRCTLLQPIDWGLRIGRSDLLRCDGAKVKAFVEWLIAQVQQGASFKHLSSLPEPRGWRKTAMPEEARGTCIWGWKIEKAQASLETSVMRRIRDLQPRLIWM